MLRIFYFVERMYMNITDEILNYVRMHGECRRRDVVAAICRDGKQKSACVMAFCRLEADGRLVHVSRGVYDIPKGEKQPFVYVPEEEERALYEQLEREFPFGTLCVWNVRVFSQFMRHIPNMGFVMVDAERDIAESVFLWLQAQFPEKKILLQPNGRDCERYLNQETEIVVRTLVSRAPLTRVEGCVVPQMEKMLVDAIGDKELMHVQGSELFTIYDNVLELYAVNRQRLLSYAKRRRRVADLEKLLKDHDTTGE